MPDQTIVIVDDEDELRENLIDLLEFKGYTVRAYSSGEDMLAELEPLNVDLFLLDYQLPGLNGLELLRILKEKRPGIPVVLVTASTQSLITEKAEKLGVDKIVFKPYSQADMLTVIQGLLS